MGKAEVTCKVCGALHDKNYLTPDARIHWTEVAKARGVDETLVQHSKPPPSLPTEQMEVDSSASGKSPSDLSSEKTKLENLIKLLQEVGSPEEQTKYYQDKLSAVTAQLPESDAQSSVHFSTSKLANNLKAAVQQEKTAQHQIEKWQAKIDELDRVRKDTLGHLAAAIKLKEEASHKVAEASRVFNSMVSPELPAQEVVTQTSEEKNEKLKQVYTDMYNEQLKVWSETLQQVLQGCAELTQEARNTAIAQATRSTTVTDAAKANFQANIQAVLAMPVPAPAAGGNKRPAELTAEQQEEAARALAESERIRNVAEKAAKDAIMAG